MRYRLIILAAALLAAGSAFAINKCKGIDGKTNYQDAPCAPSEQSQTLNLPATAAPAANGYTPGKQLQFKVVDLPAAQAQDIAKAAMALAREQLKDPDSAKFADVRVLNFTAQGTTITMTCGTVNAKNSYGGYVGAKPFWVYDGRFTQTFDHYLPNSNLTWLMGNVQTSCLKEGTPVLIS